MAEKLSGVRIASLVEAAFEDNELWYPTYFVRSLGAEVPLIGPAAGASYQGKHGVPATAELDFDALDPERFQGVLIPGGWAPDKLRRDPRVNSFVRAMHEAGKLVAFICHGGWVPISAGICRGRTVTSTPAIRDDLVNAGAEWVDRETVVDGHVITARKPDDLPAYGNAIRDWLRQRA
ncbi:MAG: type 1 glutamine amidotransferase [Armatimonadetes bacterium]|nr:type 1 glutamine amidotransferase [Armatimonadota bacterium]